MSDTDLCLPGNKTAWFDFKKSMQPAGGLRFPCGVELFKAAFLILNGVLYGYCGCHATAVMVCNYDNYLSGFYCRQSAIHFYHLK